MLYGRCFACPQWTVSGCHGAAGPAVPVVAVGCRWGSETAVLLAMEVGAVPSSPDLLTSPWRSVRTQLSTYSSQDLYLWMWLRFPLLSWRKPHLFILDIKWQDSSKKCRRYQLVFKMSGWAVNCFELSLDQSQLSFQRRLCILKWVILLYV